MSNKRVFPILRNDFANSSKSGLLTTILLTWARRMLGLLFIMTLMVNERRVWFAGPAFSISNGAASVHICRDDGYIHCDFLSSNLWCSVLPLKCMLSNSALPQQYRWASMLNTVERLHQSLPRENRWAWNFLMITSYFTLTTLSRAVS